jgi:uncharacterized protein YxjI
MEFPLELRFKLLALASQIFVRDRNGTLLLYVKQKMFKLKEDVRVFADTQQQRELFSIRADRIIDIAAEYAITDTAAGAALGSIKRQGMRSFWRAHYEIRGADGTTYTVREESVMIRILDGILGQLPIVSALTGYVFNAAYRVTLPSGRPVMRIVKTPALFEGRFRIESLMKMEEPQQNLLVLGALMLLLLERQRS